MHQLLGDDIEQQLAIYISADAGPSVFNLQQIVILGVVRELLPP